MNLVSALDITKGRSYSMFSKVITVIGASNIDISATAYSDLISGDSNPGVIYTGLGGVGRNIAENLARMQCDVRLISSYGKDAFASLLRDNAQMLNIDIRQGLSVDGIATSLYICINQPNGEVFVAASDMQVCNNMTPIFFTPIIEDINQSSLVVMDTNLPQDSLLYIAEKCTCPLFVDAVSVPKAAKLFALLPYLTGLKVNRDEATLLTGIPIQKQDDVIRASKALLSKGVQYVILTLGSSGALIATEKQWEQMPPLSPLRTNATGCGDAFFAGSLYSFLHGGCIKDMLCHGLALASICAKSSSAVSPQVSPRELQNLLTQYN